MKEYLFVASGGAVGSCLRFFIGSLLKSYSQLPLTTLIVNVIGSFLVGFFATRFTEYRALIIVGFLGGFTTYSAFSLELNNYLSRGDYFRFGVYLSATVILCLVAVFGGSRI